MKFRKKPVVIDAVQFVSDSESDRDAVHTFTAEMPVNARAWYHVNVNQFVIPTLEGEMRANVGDWIIRGGKGEFYPCKPDIFAATYEPAGAAAEKEKS